MSDAESDYLVQALPYTVYTADCTVFKDKSVFHSGKMWSTNFDAFETATLRFYEMRPTLGETAWIN